MTSGEWDLRALKALEEEEQKEFLALSQRSLFEPTSTPSSPPPGGGGGGRGSGVTTKTLSYAQLHPHLLKLPTINECQLKRQQLQNAAATSTTNHKNGGTTFGRLKFTRALSLSAHSLTGRGSSSTGGGAVGFVGGFFGAAARKTKARFAASKSIGSLSPPPQYSVSPVYTPPPVRRCATLHHTQPVRKTFKTLQQLEKQKREERRHKEVSQQQSRTQPVQHKAGNTLKRVVGTNKTYWKYGANSTAASIIGQRSKQHCATEIESNTSDELGGGSSEEANSAPPKSDRWIGAPNDFDDSATETGSCSVPLLATDTNEMMRLMLTAATTAVSSAAAVPHQPATVGYMQQQLNAPELAAIVAATGGGGDTAAGSGSDGRHQRQLQQLHQQLQQHNFRTLASCYPIKLAAANEETVAYEAFHGRRKSFSGRLGNGTNITEYELSLNGGGGGITAGTAAMRAVIKRKMLKATSVDAPLGTEYAVAAGAIVGSSPRSGVVAAAINTNSIVEGGSKTSVAAAGGGKSTATVKLNHMCNLAKTTTTTGVGLGVASATIVKSASTIVGMGGGSVHFNDVPLNEPHQQPLLMQHQHHGASTSMRICQDVVDAATHNGGSQSPTSSPPSHLMDDELEQHIKHCSCSCNHMGYGNSMDYQTTGFGGLPDVTEHSNIRRTLSRQNSISNSDSGGEIASIQKSKINFGSTGGIGVGGGGGGDTKSTAPASAHHHLHHHSHHHLGHATPTAKRKLKAAHAQSESSATASGLGGGVRTKTATRRGSCILAMTLMAALCLLAIATTLAYQHFLMAPSRNSHAQRLRIVRRILREVPLVDGHNNFAWNVRRYAHSSLELVSHLSHDLNGDNDQQNKAMWQRPAWAQTDMERLRQGLVGVQVWSAYVPCEAQGLDAVQLALEQIDIIRRLTDMYASQTTLVTSSADMLAAHRRGLMASLIGIEGGHTIGSSLGVLRSFYSLGARYLSLTQKCDVTWAGSAAGVGAGASSALESNGLTPFGKAIVREMNRLGMMIDLSYSSDATARDVLQVTRAPVIFSHSAARQLCNSTRNIPDEILRMVAENGGLIMISFDSEDVACSSSRAGGGGGGRPARLSDVVEHINYVRAIAGIQHIGLGAGYDGIEVPPIGLEDVTKYPDLLASLLEDHNWSEEHIAMLAGRNFVRIMEAVENVREYWKRAAIQPIEQTEPQPKTQCTYMSS